MSQRRTLILVAAIVVGALASFLVWNYVGGIQDQAYNDAERVKVYLVAEPIARGTSGNAAQALIVEESIPRKFRPANAIETGYARALSAILDANITTFIAAAVLFMLGAGPVRGFAVTLGIGIITSVFTAFLLSRLLVAMWFKAFKPQKLGF